MRQTKDISSARTRFRRHALSIAIGVLAMASCNPAATVREPDVQGLYDRYADAVRRMDSTAYMSYFTADFSMRNPDGRVHDRAEMEKYQRINAQTTKKVNSYTVEIESVTRPTDSTFAVIVLQRYDRNQAPMENPNDAHRIQTSAVQREIWRNTKDGPKISRIEELMVGPVLIDGKPEQ